MGINVIAVHCHQTSGDQYIDAGLPEVTTTSSAIETGYDSIKTEGGETVGRAKVPYKSNVTFDVQDHWHIYGSVLGVELRVHVKGSAAGGFSETRIYLWNISMPLDNKDPGIHWKPGVPTAGLQLISTRHSLVDAYMAFDAGEYNVRKNMHLTGEAAVRSAGGCWILEQAGLEEEHKDILSHGNPDG